VVFGIVGAGLFCFALWRVMQSLFDADHLGRAGKGLRRRIGLFKTRFCYGNRFRQRRFPSVSRPIQQRERVKHRLPEATGQWIARSAARMARKALRLSSSVTCHLRP
jgi:hypothetical protein